MGGGGEADAGEARGGEQDEGEGPVGGEVVDY